MQRQRDFKLNKKQTAQLINQSRSACLPTHTNTPQQF